MMAYKRRRWPNYALWALEDVLAMLTKIEEDARATQKAAQDGNQIQAIIIAGDIRTKAMQAKATLALAKSGEYEQ